MEVAEQFTLFDIPADEPKKVRTKWQELQEMAEVADANGGLVPPVVAASLLDVSRQRVYELMKDARFRSYVFFGVTYVPVDDVVAFVNSERKSGRPVAEPPKSLRESIRRVRKARQNNP